MLYQTIDTASQFRDQFHRCGRGDQFSYEALGLIFDYLNDCGSDVELDVVGICCEFDEASLSNLATSYDIDLDGLEGEDRLEAVVSYMEKNTTVIGMIDDETMVYVQF